MTTTINALIGLIVASLCIFAIFLGLRWVWHTAIPKTLNTVDDGLNTAIEWTNPNKHQRVVPIIKKYGG